MNKMRSDGGQARERWQAYMDAAGTQLRITSDLDEGEDGACARQVIRNPADWHRWEMEFGASMRPVANFRHRRLQVRSLRQAAFPWIHRAAPFQYLRDYRLRGQRRRSLVLSLHGQHGFARAMVAEHETYIRAVCHGLCSAYVGESVLGDSLYSESMSRYRTLYMDYFNAYCIARFPGNETDASVSPQLLPLLKQQVSELRHAILDYPLRASWLQREAAIRRPSGDTQRLPRLRRE